jgi:hypothetical protein
MRRKMLAAAAKLEIQDRYVQGLLDSTGIKDIAEGGAPSAKPAKFNSAEEALEAFRKAKNREPNARERAVLERTFAR